MTFGIPEERIYDAVQKPCFGIGPPCQTRWLPQRQGASGVVVGTENPAEVEAWYRQNADLMDELESTALEDQVVEWVLQHAQVVEKPVTFGGFMKDRR